MCLGWKEHWSQSHKSEDEGLAFTLLSSETIASCQTFFALSILVHNIKLKYFILQALLR